jgi:hypothetical protein
MKMIVAVIEAAAAMAPVPMRNSERTVDRADCAADPRANRTAHDGTDGSGRAAALVGTFPCTADHALGVADMRDGKQCQHESRSGKLDPEGRVNPQARCPDPGLHLKSSLSRNSPDGAISNAARAEKLHDHGRSVVATIAKK